MAVMFINFGIGDYVVDLFRMGNSLKFYASPDNVFTFYVKKAAMSFLWLYYLCLKKNFHLTVIRRKGINNSHSLNQKK